MQGLSHLSLHMHFLDYSVRLCHGTCCSSGEIVGGVSLLVSITCRAAWMASQIHYPQQTPDL